MVEVVYVASSVLMGALVLAIVGATLRYRDWHHYSPARDRELEPAERLRGLADSPAVWIASFVLLLLVFGGTTVMFVTGAISADLLVPVLGGATAVVAIVYLFVGAYSSARSRGRPVSQAVAEGAALVSLLLVVVIAARLVI